MPNFVYIATSIDGYIAREDGSIDWLTDLPNPAGSDYGYSEFIERVDGIVMGRKTFHSVLGLGEWPYSKRVFVLSNTLKKLPATVSAKAEIVNGALDELVEALKSRGFENLYIDGGKTVQSFLKDDMIDELIITRIPVILGRGIPLFDGTRSELTFRHLQTDVYDSGLVKTRYARVRSPES